jgi:hypothetical protein
VFDDKTTSPGRGLERRPSVALEGFSYLVGENARIGPPNERTKVSVLDWLLDSDPAIRWQVMRDLQGDPTDVVGAERARVANEGWGAELLDLQDDEGSWDGGTYRPGWVDDEKPFFDAWTATHFSLQALRDFGVDPHDPRARGALSLVRENVTWDVNDAPYFAGEIEPCINGVALAVGAYFEEDVDRIVDRLIADSLDDGGWNCWAEYGAKVSSFHTTICVLEGLAAWEEAGGESDAVGEARSAGEEYLLERGLLRSRSTGRVIDPRFTMFSFPTRWYYDVLRGLDYFRVVFPTPDDRCAEVLELVADKRGRDGRWALENSHQGPTHFEMEGPDGFPSRWNTLRAKRVLDWADMG